MVGSGIGMSVIGYAIGTIASSHISAAENHKLPLEDYNVDSKAPHQLNIVSWYYDSVVFDWRIPVAQG